MKYYKRPDLLEDGTLRPILILLFRFQDRFEILLIGPPNEGLVFDISSIEMCGYHIGNKDHGEIDETIFQEVQNTYILVTNKVGTGKSLS